MSRRIVLWGCLTGIAAAIVWLCGSHAAPPDASPHEEPAQNNATATADADPTAAEPDQPATDREPSPRTATAPTTIPTLAGGAVVRGRCVDEQARPLAGVTLWLRGSIGTSERMQHFRIEHGEVTWTEPARLVTRDDGRFELRFEPPPPYQFTLAMTAPGRATVDVRWAEIAHGALIDLGDVPLLPGVITRGRVTIPDGTGVAAAEVFLRRGTGPATPVPGTAHPREWAFARSDDGGWFTLSDALATGAWSVQVNGHDLLAPSGPLELAPPSAELVLIVARPPAPGVAITGVVVDPTGAPLRGVDVAAEGFVAEATTRRDGTFRIEARNPAETPRRLEFALEGFVTHTTAEAIAWGSTGLRVVLEPGPPLTVRVRHRIDGSPVEKFGITLAPIRPNGGWSSSDSELRHLGLHRGGVLTIDRVTTGRFRLAVHPVESTGLPPGPAREIEVVAGGFLVVDVELWPLATRGVTVVTGAGVPVAGARIELLESVSGEVVTMRADAMDAKQARMHSPLHAVVLHDRATTDADGRASLTARGGTEYALRLLGPGHEPRIEQPFRVDADEPARIVVGTGAVLHGRVTPAAAVAAMRLQAGLPASGDIAAADAAHRPAIRLRGVDERFGEWIPRGDRPLEGGVAIEADGSFAVSGIPAGTWDILLETATSSAAGRERSARPVAERVVLAEAERREIVLDVGPWQPHAAELRARLGKAPFEGELWLRGKLDTGTTSEEQTRVVLGPTGVATLYLASGTWTPTASLRVDERQLAIPVEPFRIPAPSGVIELEVRHATRALLVLDPDGEPAPRAALVVRESAGVHVGGPVVARGDGTALLHGAPGVVTLIARRQMLSDDRAFHAWQREHEGALRDAAFVEVGSVELAVGAAGEHVLRLPREWAELPK